MPSDIFLHRIQRFIQLFHGRPCSPSDQDNFTSYFWLKVLIPRIASGLNVKFAIFPVENSKTFTVGIFYTITAAINLRINSYGFSKTGKINGLPLFAR